MDLWAVSVVSFIFSAPMAALGSRPISRGARNFQVFADSAVSSGFMGGLVVRFGFSAPMAALGSLEAPPTVQNLRFSRGPVGNGIEPSRKYSLLNTHCPPTKFRQCQLFECIKRYNCFRFMLVQRLMLNFSFGYFAVTESTLTAECRVQR